MSDEIKAHPWQYDRPTMKRALPPLYASVYATMLPVAREHGYALAIHGSLVRDLDIVAVPWVDEPSDMIELALALRDCVGGQFGNGGPTQKPHGRTVWTILLDAPCFVDLGIIAPEQEGESE